MGVSTLRFLAADEVKYTPHPEVMGLVHGVQVPTTTNTSTTTTASSGGSTNGVILGAMEDIPEELFIRVSGGSSGSSSRIRWW